MIDPGLLDILRDPLTRDRLREATPVEMERIREAAEQGRIVDREGNILESAPEACLITEGTEMCYGIREGLPFLLAEEAFHLPV